MSLPRSLLVLLVAVCAAHLCAAQWPCPNATVILPCVCTVNADNDVYIDCSDITDDVQLARVFDTPFPFNTLKKLTISPTTPSTSFTILPNYVFGEKNFEEIEITNTFIQTVEEETFFYSFETVKLLNLQRNEISSFPFVVLVFFTLLEEFDISYNKLSGTSPFIASYNLHTLDLSGNTGFKLTETTFFYAQSLTELRLNDMGLDDTMPANVFFDLLHLETLYLNNNDLSGELIQYFINTELRPLIRVELIGNSISSIHPESVTGINAEGTISFKDNQIQYLPQEDWETLVSSLTQDNAIDITGNSLDCGCDVLWLLLDSNYDYLDKINDSAQCSDETPMKDTDVSELLQLC